MFIVSIAVFNDKILIKVNSDSQQTISLSIVGALTSFLGFIVVFLQLSYDNLSKIFGSYAKKILVNKEWKYLGRMFIADLTSSLFTALMKDAGLIQISNVCFNISIILFFSFVVKGAPKLLSIIHNSTSIEYLKPIIGKINFSDISQIENVNRDTFQFNILSEVYQNNNLNIIYTINQTSLSQHSTKISTLIINELTFKFNNIIEDIINREDKGDELRDCETVVNVYIEYIKLVAAISYKNQTIEFLEEIYKSVSKFTSNIILMNLSWSITNNLFKLLRELIDNAVEYNKYNEVKKGILSFQELSFFYFRYSPDVEMDTLRTNSTYSYHNFMSYKYIYDIATYDFNMAVVESLNDIKGKNKNIVIEILSIYSQTITSFFNSRIGHPKRVDIINYLSHTIINMYKDYVEDIKGTNMYVENPFKFIVRDLRYDSIISNYIFGGWVNWYKVLIESKFFPDNYYTNISDISSYMLQVIQRNEEGYRDFVLVETLDLYQIMHKTYSYSNNMLIKNAKRDIDTISIAYYEKCKEDNIVSSYLKKLTKLYKPVEDYLF